jgi:hypothetical protein
VKTGPALDQLQGRGRQQGGGEVAVGGGGQAPPPRDVMDDLVDRLAALESTADSR